MGSPSRLHLNSLQERGGENLQTLTASASECPKAEIVTVLADGVHLPIRSICNAIVLERLRQSAFRSWDNGP